jgi:hypothetical protein
MREGVRRRAGGLGSPNLMQAPEVFFLFVLRLLVVVCYHRMYPCIFCLVLSTLVLFVFFPFHLFLLCNLGLVSLDILFVSICCCSTCTGSRVEGACC